MNPDTPLIVGGGPAGAAAAIHLARQGAQPLVLERTVEDPDLLCGGFLSWRTLDRLAALDIDARTLGGTPVDHVAIFASGRSARAALPGIGMAVSRLRLDALLRARAEAAGAIIRRGIAVRAVEDGAALLDDGERIRPAAIFLATGKRDLRGLARDAPNADDPEIGLRLRLPPDPERSRLIGSAIELHLFPGGYLGLVLQEDGSTNACMAVRKSLLTQAGGSVHRLLAMLAERNPALAERLAGMETIASDAVGPVPYGWIARTAPPGIFRLGDQAACIPSLAGEGIGIALASAERAAAMWHGQGGMGGQPFQSAFASAVMRPIRMAALARDFATRSPALTGAMPYLMRAPGVAAMLARLTRI
jgi:flavin-dependent dehydrogenase